MVKFSEEAVHGELMSYFMAMVTETEPLSIVI
jgi:hypothetical protein